MPLIPTVLQTQIQVAAIKAAKEAMKATSNVKGGDNASQNIDLIATAFGVEFAKNIAPDLTTAIDGYIRSMTLVPVLVSPTGPVTGTILIT